MSAATTAALLLALARDPTFTAMHLIEPRPTAVALLACMDHGKRALQHRNAAARKAAVNLADDRVVQFAQQPVHAGTPGSANPLHSCVAAIAGLGLQPLLVYGTCLGLLYGVGYLIRWAEGGASSRGGGGCIQQHA
jgi:hypothetical protein